MTEAELQAMRERVADGTIFFLTSMPASRPADYYLSCCGGSVYIDFVRTADGRIALCRMSFDGYGCCRLGDLAKPMDHEASQRWMHEMGAPTLNQAAMAVLVTEAIRCNREYLWDSALYQYGFLTPQ